MYRNEKALWDKIFVFKELTIWLWKDMKNATTTRQRSSTNDKFIVRLFWRTWEKIHYEGEVADAILKGISHPQIEDQNKSEKDWKVNIFRKIKEVNKNIKIIKHQGCLKSSSCLEEEPNWTSGYSKCNHKKISSMDRVSSKLMSKWESENWKMELSKLSRMHYKDYEIC